MATFTIIYILTALMDFIKEIVKSVAWPAITLIIALRYQDEIRKLMPRVKKAGPTGVEFETANQQAAVKEDAVSATAGADLQSVTYIPNSSPAIASIEARIREDVPKFSQLDLVNVLIREVAVARLSAAFEFILGIIFGSQIEGLKILDRNGSASVQGAEEFFNTYFKSNPEFYTTGFAGWLRFLKVQELIKEDNGVISITDLGREFLVFLTRRSIPYNKPF